MKKVKMYGIEIDVENYSLMTGLSFVKKLISDAKELNYYYDQRDNVYWEVRGIISLLYVQLELSEEESTMIMNNVKNELYEGVNE